MENFIINIKKKLNKILLNQKFYYSLYVFIILLFIFLLFFIYFLINKNTILTKYETNIKKAYCVLDNNSLKKGQILKLNGEWEFYFDKLIISENINYKDKEFEEKYKNYIYVPSYWQKNKDKNGKYYPDNGVASYRIIIKNNSEIRNIGFLIRGLGGAYYVYIDGKLIYKKGEINRDLKKAKLKFSSDVFYYNFPEDKDEIEIIIENQSAYYFKSGIYLPIEIGEQKDIVDKNIFQTASDLFIFGLVFIMGFYHLILFFAGYKEKAYLFFGLFAIVYSYRIISSGVLIVNKIFPNMLIGVDLRIYQVFLFLILPTFSSFIKNIFNEFYSKILSRIFNIVPLILILLNLVVPIAYLDYLLIVFELFALLFMLYLIYILVLSFIKKFKYSFIFAFGVIILILSTTHDIIKDFGYGLKINLMPISLAAFIYIQSLMLSIKFSDEYKEIIRMSNELQKLNLFYQKFVPQTLLNYLKNENLKDKIITGENLITKMGMMYIRILNYKELSLKIEHDEIIKIMNMYFNIWSKVIRKNFGFIEKFSQEGILALFSTNPEILINSAKELILETESNILIQDEKKLEFLISLHYGDIVIGTIGIDEKLDNTIISEDLEYLKIMGILNEGFKCKVMLSDNLFELLPVENKERMRYIGNLKKGVIETQLYEYLGVLSEREEYLRNFYKKEFEEMILYINNGIYNVAYDILQKLIVRNSEDNVLNYYKKFIQEKLST